MNLILRPSELCTKPGATQHGVECFSPSCHLDFDGTICASGRIKQQMKALSPSYLSLGSAILVFSCQGKRGLGSVPGSHPALSFHRWKNKAQCKWQSESSMATLASQVSCLHTGVCSSIECLLLSILFLSPFWEAHNINFTLVLPLISESKHNTY